MTEPIEPIDVSAVAEWDDEVDVVVVGLGCAGASAAIEASEAGAEVLVLEAAAMGGGTSAMSGGLIYLGGGTPIQEACGYTDTAEDMERFLTAACGPDAPADKIAAYCQGSVDHYHWLVDHGVPFEARFHPEPSREPPDDSGLVFSGGEDSWPFTEIAPAVPRGHHPKFPDAAGGFLMQRLIEAVGQTAARVQTDAVVERLVVAEGRGGGGRDDHRWCDEDHPGPRGRGADGRRVHLQPRAGRGALPGRAALQHADRQPVRRRAGDRHGRRLSAPR